MSNAKHTPRLPALVGEATEDTAALTCYALDWRDVAIKTAIQRDELLAALEFLLDAVRQNIDGNPPTADQIFAKAGHAAVAAIAKAKGVAA